jgi:hypothetical protein
MTCLEPVQFGIIVWFGQACEHEIVGILEKTLRVSRVHRIVSMDSVEIT